MINKRVAADKIGREPHSSEWVTLVGLCISLCGEKEGAIYRVDFLFRRIAASAPHLYLLPPFVFGRNFIRCESETFYCRRCIAIIYFRRFTIRVCFIAVGFVSELRWLMHDSEFGDWHSLVPIWQENVLEHIFDFILHSVTRKLINFMIKKALKNK